MIGCIALTAFLGLAAFKLIMPLLKYEEKHPPRFGLSLLALAKRA